ncbi:MAG TPA: HAMP domain-containing histidine kinase [Planctomycetes bacterium]|nr:HAMP domain-containing histidine kinase [Planctomycetota bacterium]
MVDSGPLAGRRGEREMGASGTAGQGGGAGQLQGGQPGHGAARRSLLLLKWPIWVKFRVWLGLLLLLVVVLTGSGLYTTYAYRSLVKSLSWRAVELPLAAELSQQVADLRIMLGELRGLRRAAIFAQPSAAGSPGLLSLRQAFRQKLSDVEQSLADYRAHLEHRTQSGSSIADTRQEQKTLGRIEAALERVRQTNRDERWMLDEVKVGELDEQLSQLQELAQQLPSSLYEKLGGFAAQVRHRYRALIIGTSVAGLTALAIVGLLVRLFYQWVFQPLRTLIAGSRKVASGQFHYRIRLQTQDEMAELAEAMNNMTARFQAIRDDLDRQVQERTRQVVRSEQLASVGFLAAGVAHEINNPLASIAFCAESLESRFQEVLDPDDPNLAVIRNYLEMIQSEAFRCKEITEKLLDFSRMGQMQRQKTELGELVQGVIDMVSHLGKYQAMHIDFEAPEPVVAPVNVQEFKQVVLNLLTNALDSLDEGGAVRIRLVKRDRFAELVCSDDGCGMDREVLEHIFEPFYTRRRGSQGTGLGLSITYRIVADHGGEIEADSPGPGQGSTFRVRLPLAEEEPHSECRQRVA